MKKLIFLVIAMMSLSGHLYSQTVGGNRIPVNSEFTLRLTATDSGNYSYEISSMKNFKKTLDVMSALMNNDRYFKKPVPSDTVKGIFCYIEANGQKKPYLMMKSGLSIHVQCCLYAIDSDADAVSEHNIELRPGVIRGDYWRGGVDFIEVSDFSIYKE